MVIGLVLTALLAPTAALPSQSGKTCRVNQPCPHHGTTYRVLKVKVTRTIGSGFLKETTSGVFVVLTTKMTNTKSRPSTILSTNLVLKSRRGDKYEVTDKAFGIDRALVLLENLQPRLPETVLLIYEMPASARRGAVLEINDLGTGDKARIRLGI